MNMSVLLQRSAPYRPLLSLVVVLIILRGLLLPISPPGFYVDEAASGAHVVAMLHHNTDAHGHAWPLFTASLGGGYTTPVYLYPLVAWAALFGTSELALRAFSMFVTILACLSIGAAVRTWLGSTRQGLIAMAVSLALPWGWLQGSLAWDPAMVPLFVGLSFWALGASLYSLSPKVRLASHIALPLSLIALAYVYPPCRVTAPLLMAGAYTLLFARKKITWQQLAITGVASLIAVIPLALFMLQPDALARSRELSVFHAGILNGVGQLVINFAMLLNPLFLFVTGDPNLRHATSVQGMLGLAAILPLGGLVWYVATNRQQWKDRLTHPSPATLLGLVAIFGIAASLLGSALTAEGQPHSLRASAAWPYFVLLIVLGWGVLLRQQQRIRTTALVLAGCSLALYVVDLGLLYPARAATSFDMTTHQAIINGQPADYPALALQYYRQR